MARRVVQMGGVGCWILTSACLSPEVLPPVPDAVASVLVLPGPEGPRLIARDHGERWIESEVILSDRPTIWALGYDRSLGELRLPSGPLARRRPDDDRCVDRGAELELDRPIPEPDAIFKMDAGAWRMAELPGELSGATFVSARPNLCPQLDFTDVPLPETSSTGGAIRGATLVYAGRRDPELVLAYRSGDLLYAAGTRLEHQVSGLELAGGGLDAQGNLHLLDRQGTFHCRDRSGAPCAPLPALPNPKLRTLATLLLGPPGSDWLATDSGELYERTGVEWSLRFDTGRPCDPWDATCGRTEACAYCRVPMVRREGGVGVVFRAAGFAGTYQDGNFHTLDPPLDPQRAEDQAMSLGFDRRGRAVVGTVAGIVQRLEPSGAWSNLANLLQSVDTLLPADFGWYAAGRAGTAVAILEGEEQDWSCGALSVRGIDEILTLVQGPEGLWVMGDGDRDLALGPLDSTRSGPGCPGDVR